MKRLLVVMLALFAGMNMQAREYNDTIVIVNGDTIKNTVKKRAYDKYKKVDFLDFDVAYGRMAALGAPDGMSFGLKSHEWTLGLRYKYTPKKALQTYSVGLWCNWRRYTLYEDRMFVKGEHSIVGLEPYPALSCSKYSSIHLFSLSVPFFFTQQFGHNSHWRLTLGPVVNFNLKGSISNEYTIGDHEYDVITKGIEYRPVTVDIMGFVTYKKVSAYFKYSPMNVLKKDKGPQFHSLSFGVLL